MARVMIHSKNLAQYFWGEAVNTTCHIINRVDLRPKTNMLPMRFDEVKSPQLSTLELLEVNATSFMTGRILGNLIPKLMKLYSWGIPQIVVLTLFSIKEQRL